MKSDAGLATTAVGRRLAARRGALAATAAVTLAAAYFAVRVAVAWEVSLPQAVREDLRASPDAAIVATTNATGTAPSCAAGADAMPRSVRAAIGAGRFTAESMTTSDSLSLSSQPGLAPNSLIKAYCATSIRDHAVLTQGRWPAPDDTAGQSATAGGKVAVAVPIGTLSALKLQIGTTLALTDAVTHARVSLLVVGAFQRTQNPAAYWTWDSVGSSGAHVVGTYTIYDPVVADASAFRSGALHADSATLLVLPPAADGSAAELSRISAQASSISASLSAQTNPFYALSGALVTDVDALGAGVVTAHAQLLAACLLLGAVTAAGLIAAAGLLVGVGAAQSALVRARGAGRRHLLAAHWTELALLCAAAAAAIPISAVTAHTPGSAAAWAGAAAVALLAVTVLCLRAMRQELPAEVAAARGRQAPLAYGLRLGADLALVALAALALWQSSNNPLAGRGPGALPGADLIVAAAPALAVAAGAGLAGRLVPILARLAERGANRARRLFTVFAFWQFGRTPLGYLLPALVSIAAVAGGTFAVAQNASWRRSVQDQAAYSSGAQVVVTTPWSPSTPQAGQVAHARGVLAATPVERLAGSQNSSLLALDAAVGDRTVLMRPDLADGPVAELWRRVTVRPAPGLAIPGQPAGLAVTAALTVTKARLDPATVAATVQDAAGLVYEFDLGHLAADGKPHTLSGAIPTARQAAYPLRLLKVTVSYAMPAAANAEAKLSVLSLARQPAGAPAALPFATGDGLAGWASSFDWSGKQQQQCTTSSPATPGSPGPGVASPQTTSTGAAAGGTWTTGFSTGVGFGVDDGASCAPATVRVSLGEPTGKPLPALATSAFLRATGTSVGANVPLNVNGATVPALIVASVTAFPNLPDTGSGGLIVDLPALAAAVVAQNGALPPPTEWWLRTVNGAAPADLPADFTAVTETALADQLTHDPLSGAAPQMLALGAADLVLLAGFALAAGLVAAGRRQAAHEPVLAALGAGRRERTAIRLLLNLLIVAPAALLGWGLGLAVSRELVPDFVLTPAGTAPTPSVLFTTRPGWSALAAAWLILIAIAAALDLRPGRRAARSRRADTT